MKLSSKDMEMAKYFWAKEGNTLPNGSMTEKDFDEFCGVIATGVPLNELLSTAILQLPPAEQAKFAEKYSEGSVEYKKWMLNLWGAGIPTHMGCSGIRSEHATPFPERVKTGKRIAHDPRLPVNQKVKNIFFALTELNRPRNCGSSFLLTPENQKQVASILEQISKTDLKFVECRIPLNRGEGYISYGLDKNTRSLAIGDRLPSSVSLTRARSDAFFKRLNGIFEKAKAQGLSSEVPIRELKNKLDPVKGSDNQRSI